MTSKRLQRHTWESAVIKAGVVKGDDGKPLLPKHAVDAALRISEVIIWHDKKDAGASPELKWGNEDVCKVVGISRTMFWRARKILRDNGFIDTRVGHKGYENVFPTLPPNLDEILDKHDALVDTLKRENTKESRSNLKQATFQNETDNVSKRNGPRFKTNTHNSDTHNPDTYLDTDRDTASGGRTRASAHTQNDSDSFVNTEPSTPADKDSLNEEQHTPGFLNEEHDAGLSNSSSADQTQRFNLKRDAETEVDEYWARSDDKVAVTPNGDDGYEDDFESW